MSTIKGSTSPFELVFLAATLSCLTLWQLWEQDIFWQIRVGREFLQTLTFSYKDTWSFTAEGEPWLNLQWLSNILFYIVYALGSVPGLIVGRAFLVFVFLLICGAILRQSGKHENFTTVLILPLIFFSCLHRFQIRSELLTLVIFSFSLWLWNQSKGSTSGLSTGRVVVQMFLLVLSTNLHPGVSIFLLVMDMLWIVVLSGTDRLKVARLFGFLVSYFFTPYSFQVVPILWDHFFYYRSTPILNPDHVSLGLIHFDPHLYSWVGCAWSVMTLMGIWGFFQESVSLKKNGGQSKLVIYGAVIFLFVFMSLGRDRAMPFQIVLFLPLVTRFVERGVGNLDLKPTDYFFKNKRFLFSFLVIYLFLIPTHLFFFNFKIGLDLNEKVYPVRATEFIRANALKGPIYHNPSYGNYLLEFLPNEKVFIDTREMMYKNLIQRMNQVWHSPQETKLLLDHYKIEIVFVPVYLELLEDLGRVQEKASRLREFFPVKNWALVYFDHQSMILLRRESSNNEFVKYHEI